jgi:hypothetical protein
MKSKKPGGNGSSTVPVHVTDMGGWVRVYTDKPEPLPEAFPVYLSLALADWFRKRPQFHLRTVVPITKDGTTAELHAWYDIHVLANPPRQQSQPPKDKHTGP